MSQKVKAFDEAIAQAGGQKWFEVTSLGDANETVCYEGHVDILGLTVPVYVYLSDHTASLVRVVLNQAPLKGTIRKVVYECINHLNETYGIGKYWIGSDKNVYMDISLPTRVESFDPYFMISLMVEFLPHHLEEVLPVLAEKLGETMPEK